MENCICIAYYMGDFKEGGIGKRSQGFTCGLTSRLDPRAGLFQDVTGWKK